MADRNDALLLKCGWQYSHTPSIGGHAVSDAYWISPTGKCRICRPYDSVDAGIAICKERGWSTSNVYQDTEVGKWLWEIEDEDNKFFAWAVKPSEALAEAISKAVSHDECSYPDCGCDGAQHCMTGDPNSAAISLNRERNTRKENSHD